MPAGRFIIVCGTKRSGTSALMNGLREAGVPICGFEYPTLIRNEQGAFVDAGTPFPQKNDDKISNPTGLWEISSVVNAGLRRNHEAYTGDVIKVLLHHLPACHMESVDKVLMMVRNPRAMVVSRMRCKDYEPVDENRTNIIALVFMNNFCYALRWMRKNTKEYKIIIYEELVSNPTIVLADICAWLKRGDPKFGAKGIKASLNRSELYESQDDVFKQCDKFYQQCVGRDIEGLLAYDTMYFHKWINEVYQKTVGEANKPLNINEIKS